MDEDFVRSFDAILSRAQRKNRYDSVVQVDPHLTVCSVEGLSKATQGGDKVDIIAICDLIFIPEENHPKTKSIPIHKPSDLTENLDEVSRCYKRAVAASKRLVVVDVVLNMNAAAMALMTYMDVNRFMLLDSTKIFMEKFGKFALCGALQKAILEFAASKKLLESKNEFPAAELWEMIEDSNDFHSKFADLVTRDSRTATLL